MAKENIGGGVKKILYTLQTAQRIGPMKTMKALNARNSCKACGLGMGGQLGGMTNELGEFPSVCNKSVQAQSTDIQPAIPEQIFAHNLDDFKQLSSREMERLGRLNTPLFKRQGENQYRPIEWTEAFDIAAERLQSLSPERSFFYSSGRSSNEAGFLFHLLARLYGTNNVSNCSYYCHQATSVALEGTIGSGTSTVELEDLTGCDLIFVIGANPSSNHPRFIHQLKACRDRGGQVIVINPAKEPGLVKFAVPKSPASLLSGGSEIASCYLQPKIGQDIALFKGLAKHILETDTQDDRFLKQYASGFDDFAQDVRDVSWGEITQSCGVSESEIRAAATLYAQSKNTVFAWGMGMTHHVHGVENIEYISNLALLRGMVGRRFAGLLPLRGHSNVQGIGTIGVKPILPEHVITAMEQHFDITLPKKQGLDTMGAMQAADRGEMDAAIIMGGNLYAANPNAVWAAQALNKVGFKLFLTTTLNHGHIHGVETGESLILPVTARDEEWEATTQESMFNFIRLSDGGLHRFANVKPETVILSHLAKRLFPDSPIDFDEFARHKRLRAAIAAIIPGMEELADIDVAKKEFHVQNRLLHTPKFSSKSGKAQFQIRPLPLRDERDAAFTLTTIRSEGQFNSIIYEEEDSYRGTESRWSILMNRQDITDLGLEEGAKASITSDFGSMDGVYVYSFDLPKGCVMAYYPEANILTGTQTDPRSKTPSFKSTPVNIAPTAT